MLRQASHDLLDVQEYACAVIGDPFLASGAPAALYDHVLVTL